MKYINLKNSTNINQNIKTEAKGVTILWDFVVQTDRKIKNNSPDEEVKNYKRKRAF